MQINSPSFHRSFIPSGHRGNRDLDLRILVVIFEFRKRENNNKKKNICKRRPPSAAQALPASVCRRNTFFAPIFCCSPPSFPIAAARQGASSLLGGWDAFWLTCWMCREMSCICIDGRKKKALTWKIPPRPVDAQPAVSHVSEKTKHIVGRESRVSH